MRLAAAFAAALAFAGLALAHSFEAGAIKVDHPYAYPSLPPHKNGAAYLTIENAGESDRLVSASSPRAAAVEIHGHETEGGVARMRKLDAVEVPNGAPVGFAPGGLHLMLIGLTEPIVEGQTFPLTLTFEKAGPIDVVVMVEARGEAKPDGHGGHHGH